MIRLGSPLGPLRLLCLHGSRRVFLWLLHRRGGGRVFFRLLRRCAGRRVILQLLCRRGGGRVFFRLFCRRCDGRVFLCGHVSAADLHREDEACDDQSQEADGGINENTVHLIHLLDARKFFCPCGPDNSRPLQAFTSFSCRFQAVSGLIILIIPVTRPSPGTKAGQESKVYKKFIRSLFHGKCCIMVLI